MKSPIRKITLGLSTGAFLVSSIVLAQLGATVPNWTVPSHQGAITTMGDVTSPIPFIGVTPCRIVDTRNAPGPFGGPAIIGGTSRNFALPSGPCPGIPAGVSAYSLNITATNTAGPGFIKVWPEGGTQPLVSTLNYVAGQTVANAAIVPAGTGGGISVKAGVSTADVIIDINGYYSGLTASGNPFSLVTNNSGPSMSLTNNSASCVSACGVYQAVMGFNSEAIVGVTNGTGAGIGVFGQTNTTADLSVGVYGFGGAGFGAGITFGVLGDDRSSSSDSAGVKGTDGSGAPNPIPSYSPAGVRGDSASNYGMLGVSRYLAVNGSVIDTSGTELAYGILAFNPGTAYGVYAGGNFGGTGAKYFIEPHPTDPSNVIRYVCLEGPESGTYFRGSAQISNGTAVIAVPEDFRIVSDAEGLTVQLTPVGQLATMAVVSEDLNQIVVQSNRDVRFHYMVNGVRKAFKDHRAIAPGLEFMPRSPDDRIPSYLTAEARARLIANGTYNPDGTVNMATAERVGWTKIWAERKAAAEEAAQNHPSIPR